MTPGVRHFDLNIQEILDHWRVADALREVIANAFDEQTMTGTREVQIQHLQNNDWVVRDFGRGLEPRHLVQNENVHKLFSQSSVGQYGIGLKDALATLWRRKVQIAVRSRHMRMTLEEAAKGGDATLQTLHAAIFPPHDPAMVGTEFFVRGVTESEMAAAQEYFLRLNGEACLEETPYGAVLERRQGPGRIYVNGVRIAEEENFLFSYNITSVTKQIRKAMNRERSNVGRTAYADRVKKILTEVTSHPVLERLLRDLEGLDAGAAHDEILWSPVQVHAAKVLNESGQVVFVRSADLKAQASMVERAEADGLRVVTIPERLAKKLCGATDRQGRAIMDLRTFRARWNEGFEYRFVEPEQLSASEQAVYALSWSILELVGGWPPGLRSIRISEVLREREGHETCVGVWEPSEGRIVIRRCQLACAEDFAATLLHELAHALSGADDLSHRFESELTALLGRLAARMLGGAQRVLPFAA